MSFSNSSTTTLIKAGARSSPLSKAQVREIQEEIKKIYPHLVFDVLYLTTVGDRDQSTSLKTMDRTDFFTKDIDELVLKGMCRVGIHSAKDLPFPLTKGLKIFCLTKGVDSRDSLVLNPQETIDSLSNGAIIGTSSFRREENLRKLRPDLTFKDVRGTIEQRLTLLENGIIQGLVIAEAALIRLNLTHLNRVMIPGPTVEGQGRLAVVGKEDDIEMLTLFSCLNV